MTYKFAKNELNENREDCIIKIDDAGVVSAVPNDESNKDWQAFQAWLAEDPENQPDPAD